MSPRKKSDPPQENDIESDAPELEEQDWDAIETGEIDPDTIRLEEEPSPDATEGEIPDEDDDNPYQNSDEALPSDEEEASIAHNPSREGGLFDESS